MIWWLAGCAPFVAVYDPGIDPGEAHVAAVVTTTDFTVGSMATVALDDHAISDDLFTTSSDPAVVVQGEWLYQVNRLGTDTISVYRPGRWSAPEAQFSVGAGANPQDVARVGDALFVTLYERAFLAVLDPETGDPLDEIDLSDHLDGDASPEAASIMPWDGRLYVALQRFDRDAGWVSTEGRVLEVDPEHREITGWWAVGPSPTLHPSPDGIAVRTGSYAQLDGQVAVLDPDAGLGPPLWTEAALGWGVADVAFATDGTAVAIAEHTDGVTYRVVCRDGDESLAGPEGLGWLSDVAIDDRDEAWIAARAIDGGGLVVIDPATCTLRAGPIATTLDPYVIDFY